MWWAIFSINLSRSRAAPTLMAVRCKPPRRMGTLQRLLTPDRGEKPGTAAGLPRLNGSLQRPNNFFRMAPRCTSEIAVGRAEMPGSLPEADISAPAQTAERQYWLR